MPPPQQNNAADVNFETKSRIKNFAIWTAAFQIIYSLPWVIAFSVALGQTDKNSCQGGMYTAAITAICVYSVFTLFGILSIPLTYRAMIHRIRTGEESSFHVISSIYWIIQLLLVIWILAQIGNAYNYFQCPQLTQVAQAYIIVNTFLGFLLLILACISCCKGFSYARPRPYYINQVPVVQGPVLDTYGRPVIVSRPFSGQGIVIGGAQPVNYNVVQGIPVQGIPVQASQDQEIWNADNINQQNHGLYLDNQNRPHPQKGPSEV